MPSFVDNHDPPRRWDMRITAGTILRVQSQSDLLLTSLVDDGCQSLGELRDDWAKLVDIVWAVVEPQAKAENVRVEQFVEGLGGEALYHAYIALAEGLRDFFLESPDKVPIGEMVGAILDKARELTNYQQQVAKPMLEEIRNLKVESLVQTQLTAASGSPES